MAVTQNSVGINAVKKPLATNYVNSFDISKEFMPEYHNELANIYGSQSVVGFMELEKQESGFAADSFTILEEGRLYNAYTGVANALGTNDVFTGVTAHTVRVGELIRVTGVGKSAQIGIVTAVTVNTITAKCYNAASWNVHATASRLFVIGSEFKKASPSGMSESLKEQFKHYTYTPTIQRDSNIASGSELADIGWINTPQGLVWFWYGEEKGRLRFTDRTDMVGMMAVPAAANSGASTVSGIHGTQGMFNAIETRGIVNSTKLDSKLKFRALMKIYDSEGKIKDNLLYVNRDTSDGIDDFLASENGAFATGFNWGMFDNKDKKIDLGFSGFSLGSYSFAKSDLRLLNDDKLLGGELGTDKITSLVIPRGKTQVYDETGALAAEHYLELKYRVKDGENRKYQTWMHGGTAAGGRTNGSDTLTIERLTERLLAITGANNFCLAKNA